MILSSICKTFLPFYASGVKSQSADLLKLVEKLGPVLTDKKPELRVKGTQILAEVIQNLPQDCLQEKELRFMTAFFCDRLKDHNSVIPAVLQGILAIVCTYKFTHNQFGFEYVYCSM